MVAVAPKTTVSSPPGVPLLGDREFAVVDQLRVPVISAVKRLIQSERVRMCCLAYRDRKCKRRYEVMR